MLTVKVACNQATRTWSFPRRRILGQKLRNCEARAGQLQVEGSIDTGPRQSPTFWTRRCYVGRCHTKECRSGLV